MTNETSETSETPETLSEALARLRACAESLPLWTEYADRPIAEVREGWTIERALDLARRDGAGPRVGALGWLETHGLVPPVLVGASLVGAVLDDACLADARLVGASLVGACLDYASFVGARLDDARLDDARLDRAWLVGAHRPEGGIVGWTPDTEGYLRRD